MRPANDREEAAGEAFWRFSLALYARPGVAEALLSLQDSAGRDVNLILFALWLGATRGRRFDPAGLAAAAAEIAPLNAVVAELRGLRRRLKKSADPGLTSLRRQVAGLELAAERRVQYRLGNLAGEPLAAADGDRFAAAEANLALYLGGEAEWSEPVVLRAGLAGLMRHGSG